MMSGRREVREEEDESTYEELEFASSDNDSLFEKEDEEFTSRRPQQTGGRRTAENQPPKALSPQNTDESDTTKVKLTKQLALKGISKVSMTRKEREKKTEHLGRVVSLHLQRKGIEALVPDELEGFYCLAHLYLYDNKISKIVGLECLPQLESLHLNGNQISRIENLDGCPNLRRLYLGQNEIEVVEGLENQFALLELHLEHQRLPPEQPMLFCPNSLDVISRKLKVLNVSGNQLESLDDLMSMSALDTLNAAKNNLSELDQMSSVLRSLRFLRVVDLRDNPVVKNPKYKEKTIGYMNRLEVLDGKDVSDSTRACLQRFCSVKAMRMKAAAMNRYPSNQSMSGTPSRFFSPQHSSYPLGLTYSNSNQTQPTFPTHTSPSPSFLPDRNKYFNFSTPISGSPVPPGPKLSHVTTEEFKVGSRGGGVRITTIGLGATSNQPNPNTLDGQNLYASRTTAAFRVEDPEKMSEMAKIIFRLSNLSPTRDEPESPEGFIKHKDNPYWNATTSSISILPGGVKEARPLSPLDETDGIEATRLGGPDLPPSAGKSLGSRRTSPLRRPMARKLPPRHAYGAGRTLSPLEELPTPRTTGNDSFEGGEMRRPATTSPFPFQPSLPPWLELARKKVIATSKVTFNP